ncbi:hypothetical protein CC2G_004707 [Coprinopsis cinerea AmutBmut pab1-1]|nr:hypothetical protein CC2G_004707 [Coprinopsis cinerea AmutBmut pab1-1]
MKYKHRIILLSSLTAVFTYLFQPLTGSIFQVRQTPETRSWDTTRSETIGLSPEIGNLQGFLAAAGYVDAHVTHDLEEPEFIRSITGWATGKFDFPQEPGLNATVSAVTNGIRTNVNCDNPAEPPVVTRSASRVTLASRSLQGCSHTTTFNVTADSDIFYGVDAVVCPDSPSDMIIEHRPVMFWFYRTVDGGVGDARTVFCAPNLEGSEVEVVASVDTGRILALNRLSDQVPFNDVLNGDNAGKAMNGVVFAESDNSFIQTRAIATNLLVPSAILRHIDKQEGGRDAVFARPNGVLDSTVEVYRLHLTMASKTNYFVPGEVTLNGQVVEIVPRLWVDPFPAHFLAALLILTGFIGIFLHVINRKQRKKVHLACVPGTIAGTVSLASHSGWPQLLTPYDNLYDMEQKLSSLRFSLDKRTGAIIADDDGSSTPDERSQDAEVRMSLMNTKIEVSPNPESSSFAAFQTAAGVEPWKEKNKWKLFRKRDSSGSS